MSVLRRQMTLEEFLELPETKPAREYQEGRVTRKVSPKGKHSLLQGRWVEELNRIAVPRRIGIAFPEARCTFSGRSIVPDVAFITWERIPRDASGEVADEFFLAPDLEIEILSPRQSAGGLEDKLRFAASNGVRLGWLIDPARKQVTVFRPAAHAELLAAGSLDASPVLPGVTFPLTEVFGWLLLPP
jgi:Uma2 family endonuclease